MILVLALTIGGIPIGILIWRLWTGTRASHLELVAGTVAAIVAAVAAFETLQQQN